MSRLFEGLTTRERRERVRWLQQENRKYPDRMVEEPIPISMSEGVPCRAWRSRRFLAGLYRTSTPGVVRLTVNRADATIQGEWLEGITWDDLQRVKRECGFGGLCAVEVFPPDEQVVNVANMRHLFLLPDVPDYVWVDKSKAAIR
jgi:hypothetical protein